MKKTICVTMACIVILTIACNNPKKDVKENPLKGAWEVTYMKIVEPDTTYETTQFAHPDVKLLTENHFAFGMQAGDNLIQGGGGEYTYDGENYTEYVKYHTWQYFVGKTIDMKYSIDGNLWTISYSMKNDTLDMAVTETWKRIE